MLQLAKQIVYAEMALVFLFSACTFVQPESSPGQIEEQVGTSVAATVTALSHVPTPTNLPPPTLTEVVSPTPTIPTPVMVFPTLTPVVSTPKPGYACDIINQRPFDDTQFSCREEFDVKWTIVNIGTQRWEDETYLEYQSGPQMTNETRLELPRLKPGEQYDVILDATAPDEEDRQIMVWAIIGPGTAKSSIWMCYPYIRIIVTK